MSPYLLKLSQSSITMKMNGKILLTIACVAALLCTALATPMKKDMKKDMKKAAGDPNDLMNKLFDTENFCIKTMAQFTLSLARICEASDALCGEAFMILTNQSPDC